MAPTEVLAEQHYRTLSKIFDGTDIKIVLLTGSSTAKEKREIKKRVARRFCEACHRNARDYTGRR